MSHLLLYLKAWHSGKNTERMRERDRKNIKAEKRETGRRNKEERKERNWGRKGKKPRIGFHSVFEVWNTAIHSFLQGQLWHINYSKYLHSAFQFAKLFNTIITVYIMMINNAINKSPGHSVPEEWWCTLGIFVVLVIKHIFSENFICSLCPSR